MKRHGQTGSQTRQLEVTALRRTPSSRVRPVVAVLVMAAAIVGCTAQGKVTSYTPQVEANFADTCARRNDAVLGDASLCACVWQKIVATFEFGVFKQLDVDLGRAIAAGSVTTAAELRQQFPAYTVIVASCVEQGPVAPS